MNKKSIRSIAFLLVFSFLVTSSAAYAAETGTVWNIEKTKAGTNTVLTVTALNQLTDTTGLELRFLLPAGTVVQEIKPLYENENGTFPNCHVTEEAGSGGTIFTVYCVNRKNQIFQSGKALFQLILAESPSISQSNTKITYVKTVNRELKESFITEGIQTQFKDTSTDDSNTGNSGGGFFPAPNPDSDASQQKLTATSKEVTDPITKEKSIEITAVDNKTLVTMKANVLPKTAKTEGKASVLFTLKPDTFQNDIKMPDERFQKLLKNAMDEYGILTPIETNLVLSDSPLLKELSEMKDKELLLNISIPSWMEQKNIIQWNRIQLGKKTLNAAKKQDKAVKAVIMNAKGIKQYTWTFDLPSLKTSKSTLANINLYVQLQSFKQKSASGMQLSANKAASFGTQAQLTIHPAVSYEFKKAAKTYFYGYDTEKKEYISLGTSMNYTIQKDGSVTVDLVAGGDYVLLKKKAPAKQYVPILSQVTVSETMSLKLKKGKAGELLETRKKLAITLPETLQLTKKIDDKTAGNAYGAVTISYQSDNAAIVSVSKQGTLAGKKKGSASIRTTITLYNGDKKVYTTKVTVK